MDEISNSDEYFGKPATTDGFPIFTQLRATRSPWLSIRRQKVWVVLVCTPRELSTTLCFVFNFRAFAALHWPTEKGTKIDVTDTTVAVPSYFRPGDPSKYKSSNVIDWIGNNFVRDTALLDYQLDSVTVWVLILGQYAFSDSQAFGAS